MEERGRSEKREEFDESQTDSVISSDEEYEEIDVTENPLYQVLSAFFENEEGETVCDHLKSINDSIKELALAINENTKFVSKLAKHHK